MVRKGKIDFNAIIDHFNDLSLSFNELVKLSATDSIIIRAATQVYGSSHTSICKIIILSIRRNRNNLKERLKKKDYYVASKCNKYAKIFDYIKITGLLQTGLSKVNLKHIFPELCSIFRIKNCFKNYYRFEKLIFRKFHAENNSFLQLVNSFQENTTLDLKPCDNKIMLKKAECDAFSYSANNFSLIMSQQDMFRPVSPPVENISKILLSLDCSNEGNTVLPIGTTNLSNAELVRPSYSSCTFFEGQLKLSYDEFNYMCNNNSLMSGRYSLIINNKMKQINNTCRLYFKENRFIKSTDCIKVYAYCIHKHCKSFILIIKDVSKTEQSIYIDV